MTGLSLAVAMFVAGQSRGEFFLVPPAPVFQTNQPPTPQAATAAPAPAKADSQKDLATPTRLISPWLLEVARLAEAGVEENVILTFIVNVEGTFNLGADHIIVLKDLGVSSRVINAMIGHDAEIASGRRRVTGTTVPASHSGIRLATTTNHNVAPKTPAPSAPTGEGPLPKSVAEVTPTELPQPAADDEAPADFLVADPPSEPLPVSSSRESIYRVREPYPVPLTDPIFLPRPQTRLPNTLLIGFMR